MIENRPSHYHKNGMDVNTFLKLYFANDKDLTVAEAFFVGNIVKYVCRFKRKNGVEDLKKAATYLIDLIELNSQEEK